jgi:hypothetical protein
METHDSLDRRLDLALELTFPASDPISVFIPETERPDNNRVIEPKPTAVTPDDKWGISDSPRIGLV